MDLCVITTFFNPCKTKSLLRNYFAFADHMRASDVKLYTVELVFQDGEYQIPQTDDVIRLKSHSVLWQKERMINHALAQLPSKYTKFGWFDCDVLFNTVQWPKLLSRKLDEVSVVQPFSRVNFLTKGETDFRRDFKYPSWPGVIQQYQTHDNWFERRMRLQLEFAAPGYAWAARREVFDKIGIYDKNIVGSGDAFLVDAFLDRFGVHSYYYTLSREMRADMNLWLHKFKNQPQVSVDYLPIEAYHMWHGDFKNRKYIHRQELIEQYDFKPTRDIKIVNNVWEWSSHKPKFQAALRQYFLDRKEDE